MHRGLQLRIGALKRSDFVTSGMASYWAVMAFLVLSCALLVILELGR